MKSDKISVSDLRGLIHYNPHTGDLTWLVRDEKWFAPSNGRSASHKCANWNARFAETPAINATGQRGVKKGEVLGVKVLAHRVAFAIYHGYHPDVIDHINGDPSDNRIENLRSVTVAENNRNLRARAGGTSKHQGVSFDRSRSKWIATVGSRSLGRFATENEAYIARMNAPEMIQFHQNHGRNQ